MLVMTEAGRVLAGVALLGHLPASQLLDAGGDERIAAVADGELRACFVAARPPDDLDERWTVEPESGSARPAAPVVAADGTLSGSVCWVPDAPGADLFVVAATRADDRSPVAVVVDAAAASVEPAIALRRDPLARPRPLRRRAPAACSTGSARASSSEPGTSARR